MKILHCCLSCFYIDNFNYQENLLPQQNKKDGHEVKIIASTETYIQQNKLGYVKPSKYINKDGIEVTRIPYRKVLPHFLMTKIRAYPNVYRMIEDFAPDVILHHGVPAYELLTIVKYKKNHPNVKLYVDSHEDFCNSAQNIISREILHRRFYRAIIQRALSNVDRVLYLTIEVFNFLMEFYRIPRDKMEFFPLGGVLYEETIRQEKRITIRKELQLQDDDILIVHSGKMDKLKRTEEILKAFIQVPSDKLRLVLIGSLADEIKQNAELLISSDERINYLGWKTGNELMNYLCACDLYIQPGSQSATMQNAICCGSTVALYPHVSHKHLLNDSAFYIETVDDMKTVFKDISENREVLEEKRIQTNKIAREMLDYRVLASRLYK